MKKFIAIAMALVMCLGVMSMVAFAAPTGLSRLAMVGSGIPGVSEWSITDPAGDMTEVRDSVYEKTLKLTAGKEMKFKVATDDGNGGWNNKFNFGLDNPLVLAQKTDLPLKDYGGDISFTVEKDMTVKFTVDLSAFDGTNGATIIAEEVTEGGSNKDDTTQPTTTQPTTTTQPATTAKPVTNGKRTMTIKAPASWTKVCVYTWVDNPHSEEFGTYPGATVTKSGDVYKVEIKNNLNFVITGYKQDTTSQKTGDIKLDANGKNVTVTVNEDGTFKVAYDGQSSGGGSGKPPAPDPVGKASNYRVAGNADWMGNWKEDNSVGVMIEVEPGVYRKNFDNVAPGSYELKITKDGKWDNAYGAEDGQNYKFTVVEKCKITVDFTLKDGKGVISVYGPGVSFGDVSMISVVILMALASVTAIVLVVNKKKFI